MNEFNLIDTYFKHLTQTDSSVLLGIGDDAALISPTPNNALVAAVDTIVSGRHFFPDASPHSIAYKSLAVNLSDLAAMGARPRWFTLALTLPDFNDEWLKEFARGLSDAAKQFNVHLIGGDTTKGPLTITIQLLGEQSPAKALRRDGAQPGALVFVTGDLGAPMHALQNCTVTNSAAAHACAKLNYPTPRVAFGQALANSDIATSCIDISDGLTQDLGHILSVSNVGVELELATLPVAKNVLIALGDEMARRFVLSCGDEYELCFTAPESKLTEIISLSQELNVPVTRIGRITAVKDKWLKLADGLQVPLELKGFSHF